jgi:DNA-binding transcriptional MerR regulator
MKGLDRVKAASWATKATGYQVSEVTLRYWERADLLRSRSRGLRVPSTYRLDDLVQLRVLAELRRHGVSLRHFRAAASELSSLIRSKAQPADRWLAVTPSGDVAA